MISSNEQGYGLGDRGVVFVGAVYIDTILTTPRYPEEDSKLRATSVSVRRGGNTGNSLEILTQYGARYEPMLKGPTLLAAVPRCDLPDYRFIKESLQGVTVISPSLVPCFETPRSYIIRGADTNSRTIVNYNPLNELTYDELIVFYQAGAKHSTYWWHFEGRNAEAIVPFIKLIRKTQGADVIISLEIEKPGREGLDEITCWCNYVFYSKSWAVNAGYSSLCDFLCAQKRKYVAYNKATTLWTSRIFCTWGEGGSGSIRITPFESMVVHTCNALLPLGKPTIIDTVGAGDVFIGSMIAQLVKAHAEALAGKSSSNARLFPDVDMESCLKEANRLCGMKICQEGFQDLVRGAIYL